MINVIRLRLVLLEIHSFLLTQFRILLSLSQLISQVWVSLLHLHHLHLCFEHLLLHALVGVNSLRILGQRIDMPMETVHLQLFVKFILRLVGIRMISLLRMWHINVRVSLVVQYFLRILQVLMDPRFHIPVV